MHRHLAFLAIFALAAAGVAQDAAFADTTAPADAQQRQILFEALMYDGNSVATLGDKVPVAPHSPTTIADAAPPVVVATQPVEPQRKPINRMPPQPAATQQPKATPVAYTARASAPPQAVPAAVAAAPVVPLVRDAASGYGDVYRRAQAGDPDAEYQLGMMYTQDTVGGSRSVEQSYHWFTQAASKGHPRAQYNLGVMYAQGEGIVQNLLEAYIWFNLAAAQHMEGAVQAREMVAESLTPDALMKAQERSTFYYQKIAQNLDRVESGSPAVPIR